MPRSKRAHRRIINHHPFWQADKPYLHDHTITDERFRRLGYMMAFSAGAINAGGFFAVASYTSHVTGSLSRVADSIVLFEWHTALAALMGAVCFLLGSITANLTILWGKRHRFRSCYGLPLWIEAILLLLFAVFGFALSRVGAVMVPPTFLLLCYIMGIHNAVMSVLSGSLIRATHMTGSTTDLGIEIAKALYYSKQSHPKLPDVQMNRPKMYLLVGMITCFIIGGVIGAYGYRKVGFYFTLPVALLLFLLGAGSVGYDVKIRTKLWLIHKIQQRERQRRLAERQKAKDDAGADS
ncbi:YoaK family protein [Kingella sp. (in: b-proteobacteria)]|uniref:YoaK family protein n=1 Tax=Kingella sp. (in: b-proteobacteria) TaxID=2020713 RepID=UPI0026DB1BAF|nr:YoaK family protein [Kingella sp. (in: b-proteobacteria)]MDO4658154.1 YoaK family protein [Kingella sp. (in: b-proteobacteria)]